MASDTLFRQKAPGIMRLLMADFGLTVIDAAAIMGSLGHESGGFRFLQELKPMVPGSRGGYGWAQWTASRRVLFEAYCKRNKLDPASDKANYGFLWVELNGSHKRAIAALKRPSGLREKVVAFEQIFEVAGVKHYDSRVKWAEIALEAYNASPAPIPDVPPVTVPAKPSVTENRVGGALAILGAAIAALAGFFGRAMGWW